MEYQIGDFSLITRLSVKAVRYYHEEGLLKPSRIDANTGYRFYDTAGLERARTISLLRELDFSIDEIRGILGHCGEDGDILPILEEKSRILAADIGSLREKQKNLKELSRIIGIQKYMKVSDELLIKEYGEELVATIAYTGKYSEIGPYFGRLFKAAGGKLAGKPFALYREGEYKEVDAKVEAGIPISARFSGPGIQCQELSGGTMLSLVHKGPYDTLSHTYERLYEKARELGFRPSLPIREIYLKGPGMVFRGNPRNYLTEVRMPVTR